MGSFGILEITLMVVIGILVFGGDLPEVGRKIGRIWGKVQHYISMLQEDIEQETATVQDRIDIEEATEEPYYSRQQSPETKPPDAYEDDQPAEPAPPVPDEEEGEEQQFLSDVIEEDGEEEETSSNQSVDDRTEDG